MQDHHLEEQVKLYEAETKARAVLNASNVPTKDYAFYLNFAREMYARAKRFAGTSLAREAEVLVAKWVARGLVRSVLETIRKEVFSVDPPVGP